MAAAPSRVESMTERADSSSPADVSLMPLYHVSEDSTAFRGGVLSIGNFDGVHCGHQILLRKLVATAVSRSQPAVVLTFDPPPTRLLAPDRSPPLLTTTAEKARLLTACGVDAVVVYTTTMELLQLSPAEFFRQVVIDRLRASGMVEGPNFYFGKDRAGSVATLREFCRDHTWSDPQGLQHPMSLEIVELARDQDLLVSSSQIRQALLAGDVLSANRMLGRHYVLQGVVGQGAQRGRQLGFPTANLTEIPVLIPAEGVYAATVDHGGQTFAAAVHVGPNPTFGESLSKVEVHLIGFQGDLYQQPLSVAFINRIRGLQKFNSAEAIQNQIRSDIADVIEMTKSPS